ncbi:MAG: GDSL-type esterase/lipase family protein [Planctomycetota bacterium]
MNTDSVEPLRIACVGDSTTFGFGLENRREEAYPSVLQTLAGDAARVRNYGYSGATAARDGNEPYWQTTAFGDATRYQPELVILLLGVNDAQHANRHTLDRFEADYRDLVAHFHGLVSKPAVLVGLPAPAFGPEDALDLRTLDEFIRPTVEQIAAETREVSIDFYTPLADRPDRFPDGVHPDAAGTRRLAETAYEALVAGGHLPAAA